jgi:hypothetical protein
MFHFDPELSQGALPVAEAVTWAARAMGINATNAKAKTQLTYFEAREFIRLSSAMKLNDQTRTCLLPRFSARIHWT